ncbi:pyruvate kinase [Maioricimonas sp. JC845]|uniref:pyruvate kinase n=1 Tax=Maioricimonas sp. JC845 TaxID=3232138 RepID=UPI003458E726
MDNYVEHALTKTKIVATVGPACDSYEGLQRLVTAGVDLFRLNFAHAQHDVLSRVVADVRRIAEELDRPVAFLADLSGPKIRLGELPEDGLEVGKDQRYTFVRQRTADSPPEHLDSTYPGLVDDLDVDDRVLLADGTVVMRVVETDADSATCIVEQPGLLRSRQGINLPNVKLSLPSLTDKDLEDLAWALENEIGFIGLSFVRDPEDIRDLRRRIDASGATHRPSIVAKIEKPEAVERLDDILAETDVVMVARGDLGVEVDIARVPAIQKRIIRKCNELRIPVITATQMLDSMQHSELPTRAEASDVANAVLDGSDAVMLSGETAIGKHPNRTVAMMSRIIHETEPLVVSRKELPLGFDRQKNTATEMTRSVTLGAIHAAERLGARLLAVTTRSGTTAAAVSELRSPIPVLALTDDPRTAQRLCVCWGVRPVVTDACTGSPHEIHDFIVRWGKAHGSVEAGDLIVIVATTDWSRPGKNVMLVEEVPNGTTT